MIESLLTATQAFAAEPPATAPSTTDEAGTFDGLLRRLGESVSAADSVSRKATADSSYRRRTDLPSQSSADGAPAADASRTAAGPTNAEAGLGDPSTQATGANEPKDEEHSAADGDGPLDAVSSGASAGISADASPRSQPFDTPSAAASAELQEAVEPLDVEQDAQAAGAPPPKGGAASRNLVARGGRAAATADSRASSQPAPQPTAEESKTTEPVSVLDSQGLAEGKAPVHADAAAAALPAPLVRSTDQVPTEDVAFPLAGSAEPRAEAVNDGGLERPRSASKDRPASAAARRRVVDSAVGSRRTSVPLSTAPSEVDLGHSRGTPAETAPPSGGVGANDPSLASAGPPPAGAVLRAADAVAPSPALPAAVDRDGAGARRWQHALSRNDQPRTGGEGHLEVDRVRFVQRVARAFHSLGPHGGDVRLRLSPPALGTAHLAVSLRGGELAARLEVETDAARNLLLESLPSLRERLAQQDIRIVQFEVDLADGRSGSFSGQTARQETFPHDRPTRPRLERPAQSPPAAPRAAAAAPWKITGAIDVVV